MSDRPAASTLVLCLYIAGNTPNSMLAISNLQASLGDSPHDLEVVDVLEHPERALDDGVFVTPTLIRWAPSGAFHPLGGRSARRVVTPEAPWSSTTSSILKPVASACFR
jgi:circadian clock protein KaiB